MIGRETQLKLELVQYIHEENNIYDTNNEERH